MNNWPLIRQAYKWAIVDETKMPSLSGFIHIVNVAMGSQTLAQKCYPEAFLAA